MSNLQLTILSMGFWGVAGYHLALAAPRQAIPIILCFVTGHLIDMTVLKRRLTQGDKK